MLESERIVDLLQLVEASVADTKSSLWPHFGPELILCISIFLMLILRLFRITSWLNSFWVALIGACAALYFAYPGEHLSLDGQLTRTELFTGMLVFDAFAVYVRALLLLFVILFAIFTRLSGIPDKQDSADFYCMVLGATLGMCLMTTANHLLVVFLAVEMASVPSYALAAMLKGRRQSSEAALKYAIFGAGAAGVMLYGISLLVGISSSAHLPTLAARLAIMLPEMATTTKMVLALSGMMIGVGIAFKLSAVPFHFWCPDVFEGASAEVNAFLSVASKAGALALLVRVCLGVGILPGAGSTESTIASTPNNQTQIALAQFSVDDKIGESSTLASEPETTAAIPGSNRFEFVSTDNPAESDTGADGRSNEDADPLSPVRTFVGLLVGVIAAITMTFGNLAAYGQTNIKRLLAYSTIAHAGYMMLPVVAAMAVATSHPEAAQRSIAALALYMGLYLFMNLGAFAIVAFLRNGMFSEEISDYAGLIQRNPGIVICFCVVLFSLIGMPPLAGFVGKFAIFASLAEVYQLTGRPYLLVLLILGGLNTVLSLFYYLRVMKTMAIDPEPDRPASNRWSMVSLSGGFVALITVPLVVLFFRWDALNDWAMTAASNLF